MKLVFFRKSNNCSQLPVTFKNNDIKKCPYQKHLDIALDSKLDFKFNVDLNIEKCNKLIGFIRTISINIPRKALLTTYQSLVRPHFDYGDILYNILYKHALL